VTQENSIQTSANAIRKLWEKHGIRSPFRLLGFCLSLLPIPVIQQAGAALDRHLSDKDLESELSRVWSQLEATNAAVATVETLEAAITEIAQTVQHNSELLAACEHLSATLASKSSEFVVQTEINSYQQIVNSVIQAGHVLISATAGSSNILENTNVVSPRTHLHASEGSFNFVNKTTFTDRAGTISMQGISTVGDVVVTGNSVGGGQSNYTIISGGNPNVVSGACPKCDGHITVDKRQLIGFSSIQCPHCFHVLQFRVS